MTTTAFVFPGQGPQKPQMLVDARSRAGFASKYAALCEVVGADVAAEVDRDPTFLDKNEIASGVTLLCSTLELERLEEPFAAVAGYSVGQWSAMVAANMLSFERALDVVHRRAVLMNESPATKDGAMLAVIGLPTEKVEAAIAPIATEDFVSVSNYNCLGQLSLAGTRRGIARAKEAITALSPRKMVDVDVAGAWHCRLLDSARDAFFEYLAAVELGSPSIPIADNVTGDLLPSDPTELRRTLGDHIASPVRWELCLRRLIETGADRFVEVGYGDMLTKFGFFIDRKKKHVPSSRIT